MIYPATEERIWTFEKHSYYIHHALLLLVPIYLHHVYTPKRNNRDTVNNNENNNLRLPKRQILQNPFNLAWLLYAYGIWLVGAVIIHWISYYTMANINVSLCPADGVPGYGDNYRLHSFYWLMIFQILSAVIYFGLIQTLSYLSTTIRKWSFNQKERCKTYGDTLKAHKKVVEKEE